MLVDIFDSYLDQIKITILSQEPTYEFNTEFDHELWHNDLLAAQFALAGYYPDEECVDQAISFGTNKMTNVINLLYSIPSSLLNEMLNYIDDHKKNQKCNICKESIKSLYNKK